jgi:hypothetical protein
MRTLAKIYDFDNKLILTFEQLRVDTTDCTMYPPDHPDDDTRPPHQRIGYSVLFGEFDPESKVFRVGDFFPGGISDEEYRRAHGIDPTPEQIDAFAYAKRTRFKCDSA